MYGYTIMLPETLLLWQVCSYVYRILIIVYSYRFEKQKHILAITHACMYMCIVCVTVHICVGAFCMHVATYV